MAKSKIIAIIYVSSCSEEHFSKNLIEIHKNQFKTCTRWFSNPIDWIPNVVIEINILFVFE